MRVQKLLAAQESCEFAGTIAGQSLSRVALVDCCLPEEVLKSLGRLVCGCRGVCTVGEQSVRQQRDPKTPPRTFPTTQMYRAMTYFIAWRPAPRMVNAHDPALVVDTIADHVPSDLAVRL